MITGLFIACAICTVVPALLFLVNLRIFRSAPKRSSGLLTPKVSVLIPARDEEGSIAAAVRSVLANTDVELECIVLDDHSSDCTAAIVRDLGSSDSRVVLRVAPPLPDGWCGKQHACAILSRLARYDVLCFMDADVRLSANALGRMTEFLASSRAALVSGFPRQITGTWMEALVLPLIHFVLLGFLPIARMRKSTDPAYAAACGQLIMVRRDAYQAAGGHGVIRTSLHDGLQLPRAFRRAGFGTDIFDATDTATCRMYSSAFEVWKGLAKNATEGMASPSRIVPFTLLLLGQMLPFVLAPWRPEFALLALFAWLPRFQAAVRFRQPIVSALLHPAGVVLLVAIQWYALIRKLLGKPAGWKNRAYAAS